MRKYMGYLLLVIGIGIALYVLYQNSRYSTTTRPFSKYTLLSSSWEKYKDRFINKDGRVVDFSQQEITTSEGQSYAMLRSVWIDDKDTFDLTWKWTRENLKRPDDKLFGWRWGKREDETYGFSPNGGNNSASDADSDIALALILASKRWGQKSYSNDAKVILADLWKIETATAAGKRYMIAGNWAQDQNDLVVNPSYLAPYAYRLFAEVDRQHDWNSLVAPSYELLMQAAQAPLDKSKGVGLVPDWVKVNKQSGQVSAPNLGNLSTNYSYDAMRTPWRIGLDYEWNKDPKAKEFLEVACKPLKDEMTNQGKLIDIYGHDGERIGKWENPTMYATALGCFLYTDPDLAKTIYEEKIIKLYSNAENTFDESLPYYEQNWLWFGTGLYTKSLMPY